MEKNKVIFQRKLGIMGSSVGSSFPPELLTYMDAKAGDKLSFMGDTNKRGQKYVAIWKD